MATGSAFRAQELRRLPVFHPMYFSSSKRRERILVRRSDLACARGDLARADPHLDGGRLAQVAHPVGGLATAGQQIEPAVLAREPDLDGVAFSRAATDRRQIAEVLVREALECGHA